jgi:hypothetical protein
MGSNPSRSTFTSARPLFESPQTLAVILDLKKQGKAEETINGNSRRLRHLAKNTDKIGIGSSLGPDALFSARGVEFTHRF